VDEDIGRLAIEFWTKICEAELEKEKKAKATSIL
jgi:hypothetical protein